MNKIFIFGIIAIAVLGIFLFNLPKETLTIINLPPIKLPTIIIP